MMRLIALLSCPFFLAGCATSFTHQVKPPSTFSTHESLYLESVPAVSQKAYQCGPAALESVIRYWGESADADLIGKTIYKSGTRGVFNFSLSQYMKSIGFWSEIHEESSAENLKQWLRKGIPPIVMLDSGVLWARTYHFVVLKGFDDGLKIFYANTGEAETQAIDYKEFDKRWKKAGSWSLIASPLEKVDWELNESEKFNLATLYLKSGRLERAKIIYNELLEKNPSRAEISNNLAWVYYQEGNSEKALSVIETAFKNGAQRNYDILDTLGMIDCRLGRTRDAQNAFSEALSKIPADDSQTLGMIQMHMNACKDAGLISSA